MPTATRDKIVMHPDEWFANTLGFAFTSESWLESTGFLSPFELYHFPQVISQLPTPVTPLRGEEYPTLVRVWDNDSDAVYDEL